MTNIYTRSLTHSIKASLLDNGHVLVCYHSYNGMTETTEYTDYDSAAHQTSGARHNAVHMLRDAVLNKTVHV